MTAAPDGSAAEAAALAEMLTTGVVPLSHPISGIDSPIDALRLRPLRMGDLRGVRLRFDANGRPDVDIGDILTVAARLSGQPDATLNQLVPEDGIRVALVILGFFGWSPRGGKG